MMMLDWKWGGVSRIWETIVHLIHTIVHFIHFLYSIRDDVTCITLYILCACVRYCSENLLLNIIFTAVSQKTSQYH